MTSCTFQVKEQTCEWRQPSNIAAAVPRLERRRRRRGRRALQVRGGDDSDPGGGGRQVCVPVVQGEGVPRGEDEHEQRGRLPQEVLRLSGVYVQRNR